jgi:hypothetical protein
VLLLLLLPAALSETRSRARWGVSKNTARHFSECVPRHRPNHRSQHHRRHISCCSRNNCPPPSSAPTQPRALASGSPPHAVCPYSTAWKHRIRILAHREPTPAHPPNIHQASQQPASRRVSPYQSATHEPSALARVALCRTHPRRV